MRNTSKDSARSPVEPFTGLRIGALQYATRPSGLALAARGPESVSLRPLEHKFRFGVALGCWLATLLLRSFFDDVMLYHRPDAPCLFIKSKIQIGEMSVVGSVLASHTSAFPSI